MRGLVFVLAWLLCSQALSAAYKWVDEQGKVHYGDRPPAGAQRIKAPPPPAKRDTTEKPDHNTVEPELDETSSNAQVCKTLNERVARMRKTSQLAVRDENGKLRELSVEERKNLINQTQQRAERACRLLEQE